jgi:hypothetical protein
VDCRVGVEAVHESQQVLLRDVTGRLVVARLVPQSLARAALAADVDRRRRVRPDEHGGETRPHAARLYERCGLNLETLANSFAERATVEDSHQSAVDEDEEEDLLGADGEDDELEDDELEDDELESELELDELDPESPEPDSLDPDSLDPDSLPEEPPSDDSEPGFEPPLPYPSAYQPPPFRWKADKEIFFSVPASHFSHGGLAPLTRTICSNSCPHVGHRYSYMGTGTDLRLRDRAPL